MHHRRPLRHEGRARSRSRTASSSTPGKPALPPDYVLLPRALKAEFAQAYAAAVARLFPTITGNPGTTPPSSPAPPCAVCDLLQQAQTLGAEVQTIDPTAGKPWCTPPARWAMA